MDELEKAMKILTETLFMVAGRDVIDGRIMEAVRLLEKHRKKIGKSGK